MASKIEKMARLLARWHAKLKNWHAFCKLVPWHIKMRSWHAFGTLARRPRWHVWHAWHAI